MLMLLVTVFTASLIGSLHCVGMCGPFAMLASSRPNEEGRPLLPVVAYSAGRLITYAFIGLICGYTGMAFNQSSTSWPLIRWQQLATYAAGVLMVLVGLVALARCCGLRVPLPTMKGPWQQLLRAGFAKTLQLRPLPRALSIGMLTSLMPCGWLYTFGISAAGTGSPWRGLMLMVVFWAGTVPVMVALMLGLKRISQRWQRHIPVTMALLVIGIGLFTLLKRAPVNLTELAGDRVVATSTAELADQVRQIDQHELPCCCPQKSIPDQSEPEPHE